MILLDPYAARSCPVKTFNAFDPTVQAPPLDESLREAFQGGTEHRDAVLAALAASPGAVDLRGVTGPEATREAVAAAAPVIVAPLLPDDPAGHRTGTCDALIRDPDSGGYWPVRAKPYRITEKQVGSLELTTSTFDAPVRREPLPSRRFRVYREGVLLELAHAWRMLEAAGWAAGSALAAVAGGGGDATTSDLAWVELTRKFIRTYSKTAGHKLRSPLERCDHEFDFRVYVASAAAERTGVDDPEPVVRPIRVRECESCAWWQVCRPRMDDDDISLRIEKAPLDVRELQTLLSLGINTVGQLADADIDAILPAYLPLTSHRDRSEARLRQAARRARMLASGVELERVSVDPIGVPRSDVELDFDIETDTRDATYLWGVLVRRAGEAPTYRAFARFEHLDAAAETELAVEFADWLLGLCAHDPGAKVYHYSDYEVVHIRRLAERSGHPSLTRLTGLLGEHFVDLFPFVRENFVGVAGLGLKTVATRGAGFRWRDEDPGGLQSQTWFAEAVDGSDDELREASARRVLEYNEDDVRATLALREWLTRLDQDPESVPTEP